MAATGMPPQAGKSLVNAGDSLRLDVSGAGLATITVFGTFTNQAVIEGMDGAGNATAIQVFDYLLGTPISTITGIGTWYALVSQYEGVRVRATTTDGTNGMQVAMATGATAGTLNAVGNVLTNLVSQIQALRIALGDVLGADVINVADIQGLAL